MDLNIDVDRALRCNIVKCRRPLTDHAVVTTCGHVFCLDCAKTLQLSTPVQGRPLSCPACEASLANADDAVITNLNPTEDYKTSVLSGLSPNIIVECAGRALNFWAYQAVSEVIFHQHVIRSLNDRFSSVDSELNKVVQTANAEISELQNKLSRMQLDQTALQKRNEEILQAYRDKCRKHLHTQELYDKLKRRALLGQVRQAAEIAVEEDLQASVRSSRYIDPLGLSGQDSLIPSSQESPAQIDDPMNPRTRVSLVNKTTLPTWDSVDTSQHQHPNHLGTPSSHRRPVSQAETRRSLQEFQRPPQSNTPIQMNRSRPISHAVESPATGFSGYGLSAGLRVGHSREGSIVGRPSNRSAIRSRAQRRSPAYGGTGPSFSMASRNNSA